MRTSPAHGAQPSENPATRAAGGHTERTATAQAGYGGTLALPLAERTLLHVNKTMVATVVTAIVLVAGLGGSLAWGHSNATALRQRTQQLRALQNGLSSVESSLAATQHRLATSKKHLVSSQKGLAAQAASVRKLDKQYAAARVQLAEARAELAQSQDRLAQAQAQVGQAQTQLGSTQSDLSAKQSHQSQQAIQLLGSLILLENDYLTAVQASDTQEMQRDLDEMRTLDKQAKAQLGRPTG
jgi:chromosome segregation ATPase